MKNFKDIVKKPIFIKSVIGAIGLVLAVFTYQNIGLKNQNNYLFNKYKELGKEYFESAKRYNQFDSLYFQSRQFIKEYGRLLIKYNDLKEDKFKDSINLVIQYSLDILSLQNDYIKLVHEDNQLWDEYISFAKECLEKDLDRKNVLEKLILVTEEKEFYKKYASYLDSLLIKYELNKEEFDNF